MARHCHTAIALPALRHSWRRAGAGPRCHAMPCVLVVFVALLQSAHAGALVDLIEKTLTTHPALSARAMQSRVAGEAVDAAEWQFYPTPSVDIEQVNAANDAPGFQGDDRVTTLRLQQPLWTAGRLSAGKDKAAAEFLESRALHDETRDTYALRIIQAYSEWMGAHERLQAQLRSQAKHEQFLAQVQRRVSEGAAPRNDLVLVNVRLDLVRADASLENTAAGGQLA